METEQSKQTDTMLPNNETSLKIKAYKKRWVIMGIFIYYASINSFQWLEYSIITNLVVKYYNVNTIAVNWSATVFFAMYPVLVLPVSYLIELKGLRLAALCGCIGNLIAVTVKLISIDSDRYWVLMLGQTIAAAAQIFIVCLPPKIASVWFKESEISTACSVGVCGTQIGYAFGFIIPTVLVQDSDNPNDIGNGFNTLCWLLVGLMIPVTIATIAYFPKEPKYPPNKAQAVQRENHTKFQTKIFFNSIKQLSMNRPFIMNLIAYGINIAGLNSIGVFLNQFVLQYFPGGEEDVGWMGLIMVLTGLVSTVIVGILLDKTHKYKEINLLVYVSCIISVILLMFSMKYESIVMSYVSCAILGMFACAYMPCGFEFAMELTYPLDESTTTGIIMASVQLMGVLFVVMLGFLDVVLDAFWCMAVVGGILVLGNILLFFVPNNLLRQEAFKKNAFTLL